MDGGADARIGAAAADIAAHGGIDIGIGRFFIGSEQGRRRHDLARLAVAALYDVDLAPGGLHHLADLVFAHMFDGGDFLAGCRGNWGHARAYGLAVEVYGAGTALCHAAAELSAGQVGDIAQGPQDGHVIGGVELFVFAVDIQGDHTSPL